MVYRTSLTLLAFPVLSILLLAAALHADIKTFVHPNHGVGVTTVEVAFVMLDIDGIDTAEQNFTANLFVRIKWRDQRLAHAGPGVRILDANEAWQPEMLFISQQKIWETMPDVLIVRPDGTVLLRQRVWGPFSQPLDITDFPFDEQTFTIPLVALGAEPEDIAFVPDTTVKSGFAADFSLPDWEIEDWHLEFGSFVPYNEGTDVAGFALSFDAVRHSRHHVLKIILPMVLIVAMSWVVFWINPEQASTQIGVATTSMLTLIAYRFIIGAQLPPVPYLTRIDAFILGATILVFAALVQAVVTAQLAAQKRLRVAQRVDGWCRVMFPLAFVAMTVYTLAV